MRELPEPSFKLRWHDDGARYTVSKPNIGNTDVFTRDQVLAIQRQAYEDGLRDAWEEATDREFGAGFSEAINAAIDASQKEAE